MTSTDNTLIALLNEALGAEYGALFLLPQHIAQVKDEETKRQLRLIEEMELEHAEKTAQMIYSLGGVPKADLPALKPRAEIREILEAHLEGERRAIDIYQRAGAACKDLELKQGIVSLQRDEEGHQRLLERLLARL